MKRRFWPLGIVTLALAAIPFAARADGHSEPDASHDTQSGSAVSGWQELADTIRSLPDRMLAKLPPEMRSDPQVQQEIGRLAMEAIASQMVEAIGGDGDAPQFLPAIGHVFNVGQPNADTIYRAATIAPGGTYRLRGRQGDVNHAIIAQFLPPGAKGDRPHLDLSKVKTDADGRFDVLVSQKKPADYAGEWWQLNPIATRMMIRMVSADWANETEPTLSIERVDKPLGRPRPPAETLELKLRALPRTIDFMAVMFVDHHEKLRKEGYINSVKAYNVGEGALSGQFYYEGAYDLASDEALVIESSVPDVCMYRSLILTNEIYETTDWHNNHASLNGAQAAPDGDGKLRIVISEKDTGIKNWLDTSGYPRGIVQGRWTGCNSQPIPTVTKVKLADLSSFLPEDTAKITPQERQEILRERRHALQERPYW